MNHLAEETSPYLRQHRENPVDWYPWGEDAFRLARQRDCPVLLSVGYSACHWCHVMAHESFEDPDLAAIQNRLFVNIKVDREERPDVDRVYMDALQALTGSGGWPMTVFLLPDGRPFFAGTYFPPEDRRGLPGFRRVMEMAASAYRDRREEVIGSAERLSQALAPAPLVPLGSPEGGLTGVLADAEARLIRNADPDFGGIGGAPKFPQCAVLEFLLSREVLSRSPEAGPVVERALDAMAEGGLRDQLGEGFHRYSVDQRWAVPHFEKMLYDNAQLVRLYLHGWQAHHNPAHLSIALRTADFLISELELPGGGFAASLDADTEKGEGAFYAWSAEELAEVVGKERVALAEALFGGPGDASTEQGAMVLRGGGDPLLLSTRFHIAPADLGKLRESMVRDLREARSQRPAPGRDEKLIVGWNALAITALAELAVAADQPHYLDAALRCARAILDHARVDSRMAHLFDGSTARFTATLDDLAGMGLAALWLHEATGDAGWFDLSSEWALVVEAEYRDPAGPGWFDTPLHHDANLAQRPRTLEDGAQPSGTSLMAELCLRLYALTGDGSWRDRGAAVLETLSSAAGRFPSAFGALLTVAASLEAGQIEVAVLVPDSKGSHLPLLRQVRSRWRPEVAVGVGRIAAGASEAEVGPPLVRSRPLLAGVATAYVCRDFACRSPISDEGALERELDRAAIE
ncbi:MAG: thioredoxin domain-containing protein [Candidatus Dormibacteria bacterium]